MPVPFVATHDRTHADYQQQWNTLIPQGFRPISLSVYGDRADPRYAAIWVKRPGPAFAGIHGATQAQFQAFFDTWAAKGFSPTILSVSGPASNPVIAAVMEKSETGAVSLTRIGLRSGDGSDPGTIEHWIGQARAKDWVPRWVAMYGEPGQRRFAVVLDPNTTHTLWSIAGWWGEDAAGYQARFDAHAQQWARPAFVTVSPDARYLSVFREDSIGPWVARHGLTSAGYQQEFEKWAAQGYMPVYVQGGGSGPGARFAACFAKQDVPLARAFTATGPAVPAFGAIDAKVEAFMRQTGTRATGVAVTRNGRLVFARGYTWGESDYPVTQPTSLFRIASCSKPITSIAVHQLVQRGKLALGDKLQAIVGLKPPTGMAVDPRFDDISVLNLLTHTAGWDRSEAAEFPAVEQAGEAFDIHTLPIPKRRIAEYMSGVPLRFAPGKEQEYSNMGFLMLGLIVENRRGTPYEQAVRAGVMSPLGLKRPHIARNRSSEQPKGAVRHHDIHPGWDALRLDKSAIDGDPNGARPLAPIAYSGDFQAGDAFGGWCMAPVDYCKILAAFALGGGNNPLLDKATVDTMWTVPSLYQKATDVEMPNYTNGWDSWTEGNGIRGFQHGGALPGVSTRVLYRTDGWGFAVFCNEAWTPDIYPELAALTETQWPQHDLFPQFDVPAFPQASLARVALAPSAATPPGDHRPARLRGIHAVTPDDALPMAASRARHPETV